MPHPSRHDLVALERDVGRWPAGSVGAVVDDSGSGVVVELVGPGSDVPAARVRLVEGTRG